MGILARGFWVGLWFVLLFVAPQGSPSGARGGGALGQTAPPPSPAPPVLSGTVVPDTQIGYRSIQWSWTPVLGATHYEVHDNLTDSLVAYILEPSTSFLEEWLYTGLQYCRHVHTSSFGVLGDASNVTCITPGVTQALPCDLTIENLNASILSANWLNLERGRGRLRCDGDYKGNVNTPTRTMTESLSIELRVHVQEEDINTGEIDPKGGKCSAKVQAVIKDNAMSFVGSPAPPGTVPYLLQPIMLEANDGGDLDRAITSRSTRALMDQEVLKKLPFGPYGFVDKDKTIAEAAKPIKAELTVRGEGTLPDGTECHAKDRLEVTLNPDKDGFDGPTKMTPVKEKKK